MDLALRSVRSWVRWAKERRLQFRIEETNTLSIQGLAGASDTLAAALFYVDYALSLIAAGVHGVNFHDSWCSAYSAIVFPSVRRRGEANGSCLAVEQMGRFQCYVNTDDGRQPQMLLLLSLIYVDIRI